MTDDEVIERHRLISRFCERACRNMSCLYRFEEPDWIVFLWRGQVAYRTTEDRILAAVRNGFTEEFAIQIQQQVFQFTEDFIKEKGDE